MLVECSGKTPVSRRISATRPANAPFSWGTPTCVGEKWQEKTPTKGLSLCHEEVAGLDVGDVFIGVVLEELLAGGGTAQAAQHAELAIVDVGDSRAVVPAGRAGIKGGDVGEESLGELGVERRALGHGFFRELTAIITSVKCLLCTIPREQ